MPHPVPSRRAHRGGVTVAEASGGMLVLVAVVGFALPRVDGTARALDGEMESLALALRSTQRLAVLRNHDIVLTFDMAEDRIRVHHDVDGDGAPDARESVHWMPLRRDVAFGRGGAPPLRPGSDAAVTFRDTQSGLPAVTFGGAGGASESGAVHFTSTRAARSGLHPDHARALEIHGPTGEVRCRTYRNGVWEDAC